MSDRGIDWVARIGITVLTGERASTLPCMPGCAYLRGSTTHPGDGGAVVCLLAARGDDYAGLLSRPARLIYIDTHTVYQPRGVSPVLTGIDSVARIGITVLTGERASTLPCMPGCAYLRGRRHALARWCGLATFAHASASAKSITNAANSMHRHRARTPCVWLPTSSRLGRLLGVFVHGWRSHKTYANGEAVARLLLLESSGLIEPTDFPRASMFALQHFAIFIVRCILEFCLDRSLELCPLYRADIVATSLLPALAHFPTT